MLYATTRSKIQIDTPNNTLNKDVAPDGGLYVPYQLPLIDIDGLETLKKLDFCGCMALILNRFFGTKLTRWDLEFSIGRNPVRLHALHQNVAVAEMWHNHSFSLDAMARDISALLQGCDKNLVAVTNWTKIAVRIAALFCIFGELLRQKQIGKNQKIDIAVATGDMSSVVAMQYCKRMGLPIGKIICGSSENSDLWDLLHHGEINIGASLKRKVITGFDFAITPGLERLIYEELGREESCRFARIESEKGIYRLPEAPLERFCADLFPAVVGQKRMVNVIRSTFSTQKYLMCPFTALAYAALQDYRAGTGELGIALVMSEQSPELYSNIISKVKMMSESEKESD